MTDEQKKLKEHFLEPEVRDGVEVSADLKAVWKVLLDILEELIRICKKYDLHYSMEGGSLLGAIRHKGFIPWDDDVDIVLPRKDYDKLIKVLPSELPPYYFAQTSLTEKHFHIPHLMVRDSRTTGIDPAHIKWGKRFNQGIRVDVLPLDGMPSAPCRWFVKRFVSWLMWAIPRDLNSRGLSLRRYVGRVLRAILGDRGVYRIREAVIGLFPMERCEWCGSLVARNFWHPHSIRKAEWFASYREVPFEYLMVRIPVGAEKILTQQFGDWETPKRGGAWHGELVFDVNTDWKTSLKKRYGIMPDIGTY